MREILFRAWGRMGQYNEETEMNEFIMVDAHDLAFEEYMPLCEQLRSVDDHIYFMQFTGLLDKNGKKIFEGDILQHFEFDMNGVPIRQEVNAVEFVPAMFICGKFHLREFQIKKYEFEVIGNIHTDKDLLK